MDGCAAVRARYEKSIATLPNLHYDIPNRISRGSYVIDEERVTGLSEGGPGVLRAAVVYRFADGSISEILVLS